MEEATSQGTWTASEGSWEGKAMDSALNSEGKPVPPTPEFWSSEIHVGAGHKIYMTKFVLFQAAKFSVICHSSNK